MANWWGTLKEAFSNAVDFVKGAVSTPAPPPQEAPPPQVEADPFQDYYVETEEEQHERVEEFSDMAEWLEDAPQSIHDGAQEWLTPDTVPDPSNVRLVRYSSAGEAMAYLEEAGMVTFADIVFLPEEDMFTIYVAYE